MNDVSSGRSPQPDGDEPEDERNAARDAVRRSLMERARLAAERDQQKPPRRTLQHVVALMAALAVVGTLVFGFDAFLTSFQRLMHIMDAEEQRQQIEQAQPKPDEPMPAYVVPAD
jgi:hypothetical protein